jgi:hypothetical protein
MHSNVSAKRSFVTGAFTAHVVGPFVSLYFLSFLSFLSFFGLSSQGPAGAGKGGESSDSSADKTDPVCSPNKETGSNSSGARASGGSHMGHHQYMGAIHSKVVPCGG